MDELERDLLAYRLKEMERIDPKRARRLMYENPQLLMARKEAAISALQRRMGYAGQ